LESLLRLQRLNEAEQVMKAWASASGWNGAFPAAAAIAEKLGYESVAKSWREMGERK
jgi:Na+-transporting NADH:ubiquinone oxidoreductase subunit NqrE